MSKPDAPLERVPPHSLEAERSVLGSMLRDNRMIEEVRTVLSITDFHLDAHQKVYGAVCALRDRQGSPVDLTLLANELKLRNQIDDIGGYAYLATLWEAAPTAANAAYYAAIVRDRALTRNLIHAATDILRSAYDRSGPGEELVNEAARRVGELVGVHRVGPVPLSQALAEACDSLDARMQAKTGLAGLSTGIDGLDALLGGLRPGEQTVLAARPSVGKTALAGFVALHVAAEQRLPVFFVSLEQPRVELAERFLCGRAGVNGYAVRRGQLADEDAAKILAARDAMSAAPLFIADDRAQRVLHIAAAARRLRQKHGLGLLVVDYLQLVAPDDRRATRNEQVGGASRALRDLAGELGVPLLLLCQLNREADEAKPLLKHLRDSGEIEQNADCVVFLHRDRKQAGAVVELEALVEKHRNGPTGVCKLTFDKTRMRFEGAGDSPFPPEGRG